MTFRKHVLPWIGYLLLFVLISQAASWWKSRDAMTGNLSRFNIVSMDGNQSVIAEHAGEPVLLYFWATWCPVCKLQRGSVQSITDDYPVYSIASWSETEEVAAYMRDNELTFPVMMDENGQLARDFGLKGVPVTMILSPLGEISFVETGYTTGLGLRFRMWLSRFL